MLEIFSRDRETDFELFEFTKDEIKYKTVVCYAANNKVKTFYNSLNPGTILLDKAPICVDNVTDEQIEYIKDVACSFQERVLNYKKNYRPLFMKYTSENSISNTNVIEVPDPKNFKEWVYIKGYEYLQNFLDEYQRQNNKGSKIRKKIT